MSTLRKARSVLKNLFLSASVVFTVVDGFQLATVVPEILGWIDRLI